MANSASKSLEADTGVDVNDNKKTEGPGKTSSKEEENENKKLQTTNENFNEPLNDDETQNDDEKDIINSDSEDPDAVQVTSANNRKRRKRDNGNNGIKKRRLNSDYDETTQNTSKISKTEPANSDYFINNNIAKFGENFYGIIKETETGLRPIYIDGSNVAFGHGKDETFSVRGLKICIDYFKNRGHYVKAFVPQFRLQKNQSSDPGLLRKLVNDNLIIITPTLWIKNERRSPYDDWYIVQTAAINGGIIVSRDGFQDIVKEQPTLRSVVEEYRLVPTWIDDIIMFPMDPLGNRKNDLTEFLKF